MDFFDWDVTASGMTWRNDRNPAGVVVDGGPDAVDAGAYLWESLSGPQGSLAMVPAIDTDIPGFSWTSWYSDAIPAQAGPCSAQEDDNAAYGSSGIWRTGSVPNTDPAVLGDVYRFVMARTIRYLGPNAPATAGAELHDEVSRPVTVALTAYAPSNTCADADGDGGATCGEGCEPPQGVSCGDCDDNDSSRHPAAAEICDAADDDCDAAIDEGLPLATWYRDVDGDGWGSVSRMRSRPATRPLPWDAWAAPVIATTRMPRAVRPPRRFATGSTRTATAPRTRAFPSRRGTGTPMATASARSRSRRRPANKPLRRGTSPDRGVATTSLKRRLDRVLLGTWAGLALTIAADFVYLISGLTQRLWSQGRWFSENDVLHLGLIAWMIYIALALAPHLADEPTPGVS